MNLKFNFSAEDWNAAKEWAEKQPSPSPNFANLFEWADKMGKESVETLDLIHKAYLKIVNNSSSENFSK